MKKRILKFQTKAEFDAYMETAEDFNFTAYIVETGEMKYGDYQSPYVTESTLEDFSREISVDTINAFNLNQMKDLYYYPVAHPDYNINGDANILPQRYKGYQVFEKTYDIFVDDIQEIDDKLVIELNGVDIEKILSVDGIFTFNGEPNYTKLFDPSKMEIKNGKIYHEHFGSSTPNLKKVSIIIKYYGEAGYYSDYGKEDEKKPVFSTEYVDLGLPSGNLWAKYLLGTDSESKTDTVLYFQWGDMEGHVASDKSITYDWAHAPFNNGSSDFDSDYWDSVSGNVLDNGTTLKPEYDAAHAKLGGDWRMPTVDDFDELIENTNHNTETINGVKGMRFISKTNGNSIFVPFLGYRDGSNVSYVGDYVGLWSSSLYVSNPDRAVRLYANSNGDAYVSSNGRYFGYGVLPVLPQKPQGPVDLGLPSGLKWSQHLIGMNSDIDIKNALYFQWGDTEGHIASDKSITYNWDHAPFNNGSSTYNADYFNSVKDTVCPNGMLSQEYDAAHENLGEGWRMPTENEIQELINNTTHVVETIGNVKGMRFISKTNGNSIFVPFLGYRGGSDVYGVGGSVYLWSSSLYVSGPDDAVRLGADSHGNASVDDSGRCYGFGVLGVID